MNKEISQKSPETGRNKPNYLKRRLGWAAAVIATGATLFVAAEFGPKEPEYSKTTKHFIARPYDGVNSAVMQVDGSGKFDERAIAYQIEQMNKEALKDGLQIGEELDIPSSVK